MIYRVYSINGGMQTELLQMPKGADIVSVSRSPENRIQLVALVDEQQSEMELCRFKSITSNTSCDHLKCQDHEAHYLGTVYLAPTNWHVHRLCPIPIPAPAPLTDESSEGNIESSLPADTVLLDEGSSADSSVDSETVASIAAGDNSDVGEPLPEIVESTDAAEQDSADAESTDTETTDAAPEAADPEPATVPTDDSPEAAAPDTDTNPFN